MFVHDVIAAITTEPCVRSNDCVAVRARNRLERTGAGRVGGRSGDLPPSATQRAELRRVDAGRLPFDHRGEALAPLALRVGERHAILRALRAGDARLDVAEVEVQRVGEERLGRVVGAEEALRLRVRLDERTSGSGRPVKRR